MTMTLKHARSIAGSMGHPSKMPGLSYGLPAADAKWLPSLASERGVMVPPAYGCPVGALMAKVAGSTCSHCYANDKNNYAYGSVKVAQLNRAVGVYRDEWADAMVRLIIHETRQEARKLYRAYRRLYLAMFGRMSYLVKRAIVKRVLHRVAFFRWHDSGDLLGHWHLRKIAEVAARTSWMRHWLPTREAKLIAGYNAPLPDNLTVRVSATKIGGRPGSFALTSSVDLNEGHRCPARTQNNECGDCRACWLPAVPNVDYPLH